MFSQSFKLKISYYCCINIFYIKYIRIIIFYMIRIYFFFFIFSSSYQFVLYIKDFILLILLLLLSRKNVYRNINSLNCKQNFLLYFLFYIYIYIHLLLKCSYNIQFWLLQQMVYYENLSNNQHITVWYHHYIKFKVKHHFLKILLNTKKLYSKNYNLLSMIKCLFAIIENCHNVGVIVFIVIVKRIKENSKTMPLVRATKNSAIICTLFTGIPKC